MVDHTRTLLRNYELGSSDKTNESIEKEVRHTEISLHSLAVVLRNATLELDSLKERLQATQHESDYTKVDCLLRAEWVYTSHVKIEPQSCYPGALGRERRSLS